MKHMNYLTYSHVQVLRSTIAITPSCYAYAKYFWLFMFIVSSIYLFCVQHIHRISCVERRQPLPMNFISVLKGAGVGFLHTSTGDVGFMHTSTADVGFLHTSTAIAMWASCIQALAMWASCMQALAMWACCIPALTVWAYYIRALPVCLAAYTKQMSRQACRVFCTPQLRLLSSNIITIILNPSVNLQHSWNSPESISQPWTSVKFYWIHQSTFNMPEIRLIASLNHQRPGNLLNPSLNYQRPWNPTKSISQPSMSLKSNWKHQPIPNIPQHIYWSPTYLNNDPQHIYWSYDNYCERKNQTTFFY